MALTSKMSRMRVPVMEAFRSAFETHDARKRVDVRDDAGERVIADRRATGRAVISEAGLQRSVATDLETLMNTTNMESGFDLDEFGDVRKSILNFGFPDVVHRSIDDVRTNEIGDEIVEALTIFEPRLVPGSIRVERDRSIKEGELRVRFVVRADLNCDPLNLPVEFVADVERNTGKISISEH